MARKFTLTDLFGWYVHVPNDPESNWDEPKPCLYCGGAVFNPYKHQGWHQMILEEQTAISTLNARVALQEQGKLF